MFFAVSGVVVISQTLRQGIMNADDVPAAIGGLWTELKHLREWFYHKRALFNPCFKLENKWMANYSSRIFKT
jgi:hypothetical protein